MYVFEKKVLYLCHKNNGSSIHLALKGIMEKQKVTIEYELKSNSRSIIWRLIGTADGLGRWLADDVQQDGDALTFRWGEEWSHHQVKHAHVIDVQKEKSFTFHWDDEDEEYDVELRMEKNDLTDDYILIITDYTEADDVESLRDLWDSDLERLHRNTGV